MGTFYEIEAARIVCGFPSYASIASIYKETGWDKLKVRREVKNLTLFYKIYNNLAPEYLSDLIPPTVSETSNYYLRNSQNISQQVNRLALLQQSFFPSTIKLWNTLDLNIRQIPILALSFWYPHIQFGFEIKLVLYKSSFNELHLFLNLYVLMYLQVTEK
jgi:hypothetical protein